MDSQGEVAREHGPERRQEGRPPVGERGPAEEGDPATGVKFGGCGTSRDAAARRTATSKKAGRGDTSGDGMRDPAHDGAYARIHRYWALSHLPAGPGGWGVGPGRRRTPHARNEPDLPRARVRGTVGVARRAGLLAYGSSGPGRPSRASRQWRFLSGGLAEYSGGPAPGSHRLPYSPPPSARGGGTYREDILQASDLGESSLRAPAPPR